MYRLQKIILAVVLASVLVSGLVMAGCSVGCTPSQGTQIGNLAPDFQLSGLDGQIISLSDFRGKPVLINFWASWCNPCRAEMPFLQRIHEEWADKGLVMLAVDIGESPSRVNKFVESFGLSFLVLLDAKQEVAREYNIRSIPTTFFIDKNGKIKDMKIGAFSSKAEIERRLSKVIP